MLNSNFVLMPNDGHYHNAAVPYLFTHVIEITQKKHHCSTQFFLNVLKVTDFRVPNRKVHV